MKIVLILYIVSLSNGTGAIATIDGWSNLAACEEAGKKWDNRVYAMYHECMEVK
jgi:hypothetical protein